MSTIIEEHDYTVLDDEEDLAPEDRDDPGEDPGEDPRKRDLKPQSQPKPSRFLKEDDYVDELSLGQVRRVSRDPYVFGSYLDENNGLFFAHSMRWSRLSLVQVESHWVARDRSLVDVAEDLVGLLGEGARYFALRNDRYVVERGPVLVMLDPASDTCLSTEPVSYIDLPVRATGPRAEVDRVVRFLDGTLVRARDDRNPIARWWYKTRSGVSSASIRVSPPSGPLHVECYPWVPGGYDAYLDGYLSADSATLLFLAGPPGTGKTTLLRHMICSRNLRAAIAYDEEVFDRDSVFINFMTRDDEDVLIVEDADLLLTSREHAGNKLMSRFLNVSDGIVRFPKKKIVFTTNLHDFRDVDAALLRPGRCHGCLHARELTYDEAVAACQVIGVDPPARKDRGGTYSLAELYNRGQVATVPRLGFV